MSRRSLFMPRVWPARRASRRLMVDIADSDALRSLAASCRDDSRLSISFCMTWMRWRSCCCSLAACALRLASDDDGSAASAAPAPNISNTRPTSRRIRLLLERNPLLVPAGLALGRHGIHGRLDFSGIPKIVMANRAQVFVQLVDQGLARGYVHMNDVVVGYSVEMLDERA